MVELPSTPCYVELIKRVYPHAVSLMEMVRMYGQTLDLVESNSGIEWLVAEYRNESQRMSKV